tara:strand:+ start:10403 stop:11281 length:879 start_codon:yes stop_codon:yes gene_type:complete
VSAVWPNGSVQAPPVSREFGYRDKAYALGYHQGIDLKWSFDYNVSPVDGVVTYAGYNGQKGNEVVVRGDDGIEHRMAHNSAIYVSRGQRVSKGQRVGMQGSTGMATGRHTHYEVRPGGGTAINPRTWMAAANASLAGGNSSPFNPRNQEESIMVPVSIDGKHLAIIGKGLLRHLLSTDPNDWIKDVLAADDQWVSVSSANLPALLVTFDIDLNAYRAPGGAFEVLDPLTGTYGAGRVWSRERVVQATIANIKPASVDVAGLARALKSELGNVGGASIADIETALKKIKFVVQ